jgi:hypothetical protein
MEDIEAKIAVIIRQTNYNSETALQKLKEFEFNEINVIRDYLGIKKNVKREQPKTINQEIYCQLRYNLDNSMREYNERVEKGEAKKII